MASLVRWARTTLVCVLSLGGGVVAAQGTGTISGVVVDSASRQPISNATVAVTGTRLGTLTREEWALHTDRRAGGDAAGARRPHRLRRARA